MANHYTIELNYKAAIILDVEAVDEGEALTKARELAEMAPMSRYVITEESNSRVLNVQTIHH